MASFLNALPGAVSQGLIWGIMAIGVYITYRILELSDLTVDGSFCTGAAVCVMMVLNGANVAVAMLCAFLVGMACGLVTGLLHTGLRHPRDFVRHFDAACAVEREPCDHGHEGQPGAERSGLFPRRLSALSAGRRQGHAPVLAAPDLRRRAHDRRRHRHFVLVLRHGDRLRHPRHGRQRGHVPCAGHQHAAHEGRGAYDRKRSGRAVGLAACAVSELRRHQHGPRRDRHRPCRRHQSDACSSARSSAISR